MANRFLATIRLVVETASREGFRVALIGGSRELAPVDCLFARRPATLEMLRRATPVAIPGDPRLKAAVVDAEGIIGLKVQAIANDSRRRRQDEADILSLLRIRSDELDIGEPIPALSCPALRARPTGLRVARRSGSLPEGLLCPA